jgi:Glyoxalase-like domain
LPQRGSDVGEARRYGTGAIGGGMTALPVPTLDHVVVNVRDQLDEALEAYQRLGFTMTPRGYHTLGSMNHLAILGTEYLELIAARPSDTARPEILGSPAGLNGLVFGTDDSTATYSALHEAGVPVLPPLQFSRPVALEAGARDATFRTVRLPPETTEAGRIYFCHHFSRDLVWRDEWRHHPNGAIGIVRAVIAARDPGRLGGLFATMFGSDSVQSIEDGRRLVLGLSRFDVITPHALHRQFGDVDIRDSGRDEFMAALTIRTRSIERAAKILHICQGRRQGDRVIVPPSASFGVVLEFCE